MNAAACHGLAGEVVGFLEPHTEADPPGLLLTFLSAVGIAIGDGPHAIADGARHPARLNAVLVGRSSRARKGTSWAMIRKVFEAATPEFVPDRVVGGLSSGEGLVADLARRPSHLRSVLVFEPEFARLLRVGSRSATLSALVREAWDGGELAIRTRKDPISVCGANVAILGHITADELRLRLNSSEISNGFGNRMLFAWVERSKRLPTGSEVPKGGLQALGHDLREAIDAASEVGELRRTPAAEELWREIYLGIDDDVPGVVGALTARCEAQLLRLSVAYALLDRAKSIDVAHLQAACGVWAHSTLTIERVFDSAPPDPVSDRLLDALRRAGSVGLDGTQQRDLFSRHVGGTHLAAARQDLERRGLIETRYEPTGGRPRVWSRALPAGLWSPRAHSSPCSDLDLVAASTRSSAENDRFVRGESCA